MILVTIDLISAITHRRSTLGVVKIANDGTGPREVGNYDVQLLRKGSEKAWRVGRVTGFRRLSRGPYDLLHLALVACGIPARNTTAEAAEDPMNAALDEYGAVLREALQHHADPVGAVRRLTETIRAATAKPTAEASR